MRKQDLILKELCLELAEKGVQTDRFTQLWIESGVLLDGEEFEIANRILKQHGETDDLSCRLKSTLH